SRLTRMLKDAEIAVMALAAIGLIFQLALLIYVAIFLIGLQATVFGPVKYAYLPQHLHASELTRGNGLIEMATFVAILMGTILAGLLIEVYAATGAAVVAATIVLLAIL